jgi:hypothetical protein
MELCRLPMDTLKAFSQSTIFLVLLLDPHKVAIELSESGSILHDAAAIDAHLRAMAIDVLRQTSDAGFTTVFLTSSDWVKAAVDMTV